MAEGKAHFDAINHGRFVLVAKIAVIQLQLSPSALVQPTQTLLFTLARCRQPRRVAVRRKLTGGLSAIERVKRPLAANNTIRARMTSRSRRCPHPSLQLAAIPSRSAQPLWRQQADASANLLLIDSCSDRGLGLFGRRRRS